MEFREIRDCTPDERRAIDAALAMRDGLRDRFDAGTEEGVQILCSSAARRDDPDFTIAVGVIFGEFVRRELGLRWARLIDEMGEENALQVPGSTITVHPISMIQKRIARDETIDVTYLVDEIAQSVRELREKLRAA